MLSPLHLRTLVLLLSDDLLLGTRRLLHLLIEIILLPDAGYHFVASESRYRRVAQSKLSQRHHHGRGETLQLVSMLSHEGKQHAYTSLSDQDTSHVPKSLASG